MDAITAKQKTLSITFINELYKIDNGINRAILDGSLWCVYFPKNINSKMTSLIVEFYKDKGYKVSLHKGIDQLNKTYIKISWE